MRTPDKKKYTYRPPWQELEAETCLHQQAHESVTRTWSRTMRDDNKLLWIRPVESDGRHKQIWPRHLRELFSNIKSDKNKSHNKKMRISCLVKIACLVSFSYPHVLIIFYISVDKTKIVWKFVDSELPYSPK
jgi:hypothetical protein